jgi:hypothetical protein
MKRGDSLAQARRKRENLKERKRALDEDERNGRNGVP